MRWWYFENYSISKAHYFFKLGREKNIFVKFVFIRGWKKKWTNTAVPEDHEDLCWKSEDCVGVVFSRDLVWVCAYSYFWWRPWRPFYILNIIDKRKNKKEHFCSSGSSGETRGYTTSNLITAEGLVTWSSEVFRKFSSHVVKWKSYKNRKLKEVLCVVFRSLKFEENEKKCVYFVHNCLQFLQLYSFTYTTYKPSHRSHTIIPLSNHHTIIILKSIELRNICF